MTLRGDTQRQAPSTGFSGSTRSTDSTAALSGTSRSKVTMMGKPTPTFSVFSPMGVMSAMPILNFLTGLVTGLATGLTDGFTAGWGVCCWAAGAAGATSAAQATEAASATAARIRGTRFTGGTPELWFSLDASVGCDTWYTCFDCEVAVTTL